MKGKFFAPSSLMQLDETLNEHKPYAALVVSTTGLDSTAFSDHYPTRVCLKQFEWDIETKSYKEAINFDKMVKAPQSAIDEAVKNADSYDAFANGGIDKDAYQKGTGVLSVEEFQKEFHTAMSALQQDDTTLIINGTKKFAEQYLGKIGCQADLEDAAAKGRLIEQTRLTQEYFQKKGITGKADLETLRNSMLLSPTGSFINDEKKMQDFHQLSKEDFLKAHPDVTEKKYSLTERDVANRTGKIIGGDKRIEVINDFITKHGRDENILENEWRAKQRESEAIYMSELSEKGRKRYKNDSFHEKFGCLIEKGVLSPDDILQGNSEFQKLINMIEDKNNKGFVIIHAASTGFDFNAPSPRNTGFPIQFSAVCYTRDGDKIDFSQKPKGIEFTIAAPERDILRAEKNITNERRPYDAFQETGIVLEDYKAGKGVFSQEEATKRINNFFKECPPEHYPIVAIGGTKGSEHSFAQTCMSNLANFAMCEAPHIDFTQVIKEYAFLAHHDDAYPKNVMFDEENLQGKTFGLQDVASARGSKPLNSTSKKCIFTANMMRLLEQQQLELFRPEELAAETPSKDVSDKTVKSPVQANNGMQAEQPYQEASKEDVGELSEDEAFIEGNGYDNVSSEQPEIDDYEEELTPDEKQALSRAQNEDFAEHLDLISEGIQGGDTKEHGRLYSDKRNDSVPIVKAENVRQVGEAPIPHVSEAQRKEEISEGKVRNYRRERSVQRPFRPAPTPSQEGLNERGAGGTDSLNVARLVEIIAAQSEIIQNQSNTISQMNVKLMNLLLEQNQFMKAVIEDRAQETRQPPIAFNEREQNGLRQPNWDAKDNGSVVNFMEAIKEQISDLREQLPSERAKEHLSQANQSLSNGQKEVERAEMMIKQERNAS